MTIGGDGGGEGGTDERPKNNSSSPSRRHRCTSPHRHVSKVEEGYSKQYHPSSPTTKKKHRTTATAASQQNQYRQQQRYQHRRPKSPHNSSIYSSSSVMKRSTSFVVLFGTGVSLFLFNTIRIFCGYNKVDSKVSRQVPNDLDHPIYEQNSILSSSSLSSSLFDGGSRYHLQGFCDKRQQQQQQQQRPQQQREDVSSSATTSSSWKHPKFLFGIPSTLSSPLERDRRQLLRETYLSFDQQIRQRAVTELMSSSSSSSSSNTTDNIQYMKDLIDQLNLPPNRVCSLQEYTCGGADDTSSRRTDNNNNIREDCQIIYAFFVGGNASAPPYILNENLDDFRSMLYDGVKVSSSSSSSSSSFTKPSGSTSYNIEPGLVTLNIRENQFDGKMTTWFQFAALVGQEYPEIDYAVKADSDTLLFTPNFLEHMDVRHREVLSRIHYDIVTKTNNNNKRRKQGRNDDNNINWDTHLPTVRVYGGLKYPKTYCGMNETHHACPLPLVGDTYMSGELNFMSMDLARFIASNACPRDRITLPHEDVSLSNYVYSYTNNTEVIQRQLATAEAAAAAALSSSSSSWTVVSEMTIGGSTVNTTIERIFIHPERLLLTFNQSADWESKVKGLTVDLKNRYRRFLWGHSIARKDDFGLYSFFKQPDKVQQIWNEFVTYYFDGEYRPMIQKLPRPTPTGSKQDPIVNPDESNKDISPTPPADNSLGNILRDPAKDISSARSSWTQWTNQASKTIPSRNDQWKHRVREWDRPLTDDSNFEDHTTMSEKRNDTATTTTSESPPYQSCAILLFGLPRSFRRNVLPSIIRNVMIPNLKYGCDYYMHYYHFYKEGSSRSGHGGSIDPNDVLLLRDAMGQIYNNSKVLQRAGVLANRIHQVPHVSFTMDTNDTFWEKRSDLVYKYRTTKGTDGKYLYFSYSEVNYEYPNTMDNIVKQWHSIDAVWKYMEAKKGDAKVYDRVAMIRNDVVYITPLDVYKMSDTRHDFNNQHMIVPNWANWPVNDRMISGPYDAVKIWATERFSRIDQHVRNKVKPGVGMHPERFLHRTILPAIRTEFGYTLDRNKRICFVRVRADGAIWIDDCTRDQGKFPQNATMLLTLNLLPPKAKCRKEKLNEFYDQLYCDYPDMGNKNLLWNLEARPKW